MNLNRKLSKRKRKEHRKKLKKKKLKKKKKLRRKKKQCVQTAKVYSMVIVLFVKTIIMCLQTINAITNAHQTMNYNTMLVGSVFLLVKLKEVIKTL